MAKVIVVGANHAGTAFVNTLTGNYKNNEVVVYDKNSNISFLGCGMALWIGEQIKGSEGLFYSDKEKLEANGAKVHMETEVISVDFGAKTVTVRHKDGREVKDNYDQLVFATGSIPVTLPVPGSDLNNIQLVKLFQNAQEVIDKLSGDHLKLPAIDKSAMDPEGLAAYEKLAQILQSVPQPKYEKIAVLGGGYIGVELAEAFERLGREVVLIDMADRVLSTYFDPEYSHLMGENMKNHGIKLALGEKVIEFIDDGKGNVKGVRTDKGVHDADMVISCVGFRPNNVLGKDDLALFKNGAYLVNKKQETSIPGVYAIGDCATVYDNSIEDTNYIALATNAVRSGIVAAHNVGGTAIESLGVQGSSGICIYDLKMVNTGLSEEKAKARGIDVLTTSFSDTQKPAFMEVENPKVDIKIVYRKKDRVIVGAQIASTYDMSAAINMFSLAVQKKVTIEEIALLDIFFMPHFNQPYNYITMAAITAK